MFPQISVGTFSAYLTLQALYCIIIIAGIAINCAIEVSTHYTAFVLYLLIYPSSGRAGKFKIVFLFILFNLSECQQKRGSYIKIQRKAQSKLYASNFPMWVGKFANSHLCEALFERP